MEFTNDILEKIRNNKNEYNSKYKGYYYKMFFNTKEKTYLEKSNRIGDCMSYWQWDAYHKNQLLDLKKVNRCMNNRFCPNCRKMDLSKFIYKFKDVFNEYKDYNYYFLTLTIPSCKADDLEDTLVKLNNMFAKFKEKFSYEKFTDTGKPTKKAFQERLIDLSGGIRVLEITYNQKNGYHPHYHCVVLTKDKVSDDLMEKRHKARFSIKRNAYDYKSDIEVQISQIWSMIYNGDEISSKNYNKINYDVSKNEYEDNKKVLEVDFKEFDIDGLYEVFKYTFKDSDIPNFSVFDDLNKALQNKRIRQGFGVLYNLKTENIVIGEQQELELMYEENPEDLLIKSINELFTIYKGYKKISRYNTQIDNNIKD